MLRRKNIEVAYLCAFSVSSFQRSIIFNVREFSLFSNYKKRKKMIVYSSVLSAYILGRMTNM